MKNIKIQKKYIFLIIALIIVSNLLAAALFSFSKSGMINNKFISPGTMLVMLIFLILLPVLLIAFMVALALRWKYVAANTENTPVAEKSNSDKTATEKSHARQTAEEEAAGGNGKRFFMLCQIDENRNKYRRGDYNGEATLKDLCDSFRNFAANKLKLYYDISDIRKFVAGLGVSRIIILQGISGTGKTSLAYAFGEFLSNASTVFPVQPMWKERTDLIGYYNEFTKRFNETILLQKMYEANYSKDIYITILDEMNIARIEYYFAEFLSLLELPNPEKRYLDIISDKWETDPAQFKNGQIKLPDNMWFVGTANNDDSTFSISDKVYDRAMILDLNQKSEAFTAPTTEPVPVSVERFRQLVEEAQREYKLTRRNKKRLEALDKYLIENFHLTFGNRIMKQITTFIPIYLSCGGDELEALDDILAKKLMRKLEMQNPVYLRNAAEGFCAYLDELFGTDKMKYCKQYIARIAKNA